MAAVAVRVFHGDDNDMYRRIVRELLPADDRIEMVGEAATAEAVVAGVADAQPDVVLLDQMGGAELIDRVRAAAPRARIIVFSGYQPDDGDRAMAARADGYVVKAADFDAVRGAVLGG